jgi:tetratricopeptide (TPR) repeat protein
MFHRPLSISVTRSRSNWTSSTSRVAAVLVLYRVLESDYEPSAEDARQRGNDLYRQKRFADAIEQYKEAATLAPTDTAPMGNLSAALFELGDYQQCVQVCQDALTMVGQMDGPNDALRQKLLLGQAKAALHTFDMNGVATAAKDVTDDSAKAELKQCAQLYKQSLQLYPDAKSSLAKLLLDKPRYKPMM